jgi:hypothetical protein
MVVITRTTYFNTKTLRFFHRVNLRVSYDVRLNSDHFPKQHYPTGLRNWNAVCFIRSRRVGQDEYRGSSSTGIYLRPKSRINENAVWKCKMHYMAKVSVSRWMCCCKRSSTEGKTLGWLFRGDKLVKDISFGQGNVADYTTCETSGSSSNPAERFEQIYLFNLVFCWNFSVLLQHRISSKSDLQKKKIPHFLCFWKFDSSNI